MALGIDFGTKRVGLAVTDATKTFVFPRDTLIRGDGPGDIARLHALCQAEGVEILVVGLPLNADGSEGPMAKLAREYGASLSQGLGLPHCFVDERYTSEEADEHLRARYPRDTRKRKALRDRGAAVLILRTWLDHGPMP